MATVNPSTGSSVPQVLLSLRQGPMAGQSFSLAAPTIIIGRHAGNEVVINDPDVSRRHACLSWDGRQFVIQDMGSANGTFVNGARLTGPRVVHPGDTIGLGNAVLLAFRIHSHVPAGGPAYAPPPVGPATPAASTGSAGRKRWPLIVLGLAAGLLLLALVAGVAAYFWLQRGTPAGLMVLIEAPRQGQQVALGEAVNVHAVARDPDKVRRVELWVDGQLLTAQDSTLRGGTSPLPLLTVWQPTLPGSHTLMARAFDTRQERAQASITVVVAAGTDRDGDGTTDDVDACPDEAGSPAAQGCPDADGDGVADNVDACPTEAGLPEADGCPAAGAGDRDGDGVLDAIDACPDEPGSPIAEGCPDADGDGVADRLDSCPTEPGLGDDGCPAGADTDGDGLADSDDACPTEPGSWAADGCPDADGDGIPDSVDMCPTEAGPPPDGCPVVVANDRDGDGVPDGEDACPDVPGPPWTGGCPDRDGDGVPDATDVCPDTPGPASNGGCPTADPSGDGDGDDDRDGDGVPDGEDACPDDWGSAEASGCPDRDGDGIPDHEDLCPDIPGLPENAGCPEPPGSTDTDGDGIIDDLDMCPDEAGPPENEGCPDEGGGGFSVVPEQEQVEFQALTFESTGDEDLDDLGCYVSLAGSDREYYRFDPLGENQWNIAAELGGENSVLLLVNEGDPVTVEVECNGQEIHLSPGEGWGTVWNLGSFGVGHPAEQWDGRVLTTPGSGGDGGRSYRVGYRLCAGSCDEALLRPPDLHIYHDGGGYFLRWFWDGDVTQIDGFGLYVNGNYVRPLGRDASSHYVNDFQPACGSIFPEYQLTARVGDAESPLSNAVHWTPDACPRVARVTFDTIYTGNMGDDEWWADGESVGPILGNFWAQGATFERLDFDAAYPSPWWGGRPEGYRLEHGSRYQVQDIFDWIITQITHCMGPGCAIYSGPDVNSVEIELGPYDDLTFGAGIYDFDTGNPSDTLFDGERTLEAGHIVPGRYSILDRHVQLDVVVDMLVGPEAGDLPELMITNVELVGMPGQMRVMVFNGAADLIDQDLMLHVVNRRSGDVVLHETWTGESIPSGGVVYLQTLDTYDSVSDLRLILDPENAIPEMDDGNNIYETPVSVRVSFLGASAPYCNESDCDVWDCDGEFVFHFWAGYGPDADHVSWVAYHERFPESGELITCGRDLCDPSVSPPEDWVIPLGDERYTFEFDVPVDQNVYVSITGVERDTITDDDSLGRVFEEYTPYENWGAGSDVGGEGASYRASSGSSSCDDADCEECPEGLTGSWNVTRVR